MTYDYMCENNHKLQIEKNLYIVLKRGRLVNRIQFQSTTIISNKKVHHIFLKKKK